MPLISFLDAGPVLGERNFLQSSCQIFSDVGSVEQDSRDTRVITIADR